MEVSWVFEKTKTISKQARGNAADCAGKFQSEKWLNSARYIWQPGTEYKTSEKTDQWLSRRPSVVEDRRLNTDKSMAQQFDPADFLDDPVNEQEAWARRITCNHTFSDIMAATVEKTEADD